MGESVFNRTVSANLGMSYSISNVLTEAGMGNILRWLPFDINLVDLQNRIKNKMIRPTTIPQLLEELIIEHAIAREALRLAFEQHKKLAVELKGVQQQRTISEAFTQTETGNTLVSMFDLNLIVGSGGVLSHAPRRQQSMLMMIDAFLPEGVTQLAVDSIFMMPQLGVLSQVNKEAATQVFNRDCLIHLGTCIAPTGQAKKGSSCLEISVNMPSGIVEDTIPVGELKLYQIGMDEVVQVKIQPNRHFDAGAGNGQVVETEVRGGVVGLVIDTRGRPLEMSADTAQSVEDLKTWLQTLDVYPL